jgi:hypothetical protein
MYSHGLANLVLVTRTSGLVDEVDALLTKCKAKASLTKKALRFDGKTYAPIKYTGWNGATRQRPIVIAARSRVTREEHDGIRNRNQFMECIIAAAFLLVPLVSPALSLADTAQLPRENV